MNNKINNRTKLQYTTAPVMGEGNIGKRISALPWPRYGLFCFVMGYFLWSLVPVVIAFAFSFNAGTSRSVWQGFSVRWWLGPDSLLANPQYYNAICHSFLLAVLAVLISVPLGVTLSIFLSRWRGVTARAASLIGILPLVVPELILALAMFYLITGLFNFIPLGTPAQVVGQVTFILPSILVISRGRLANVSSELEEAAIDLGANSLEVFWLVLVPLLQPAILASIIVAFAVSIDDFVITQYLSSNSSSQTVPMLIYNTARGPASPALNATATVVALFTIAVSGIGYLAYLALLKRGSSAGLGATTS